jgi:hypothetical protein
MLGALQEKRVQPERFSRPRMFDHMLEGEPSLFSHLPVCLRYAPPNGEPLAALLQELRTGFPRAKRARVRANENESIRYLPIPAVVNKWCFTKSTFGVTDLHYVGTRFDARLDTAALNDFNLLPRGTEGFQSQDSLVISSTGAVTDSHSDDHSGSNHCFTGAKLWLMWELAEGFDHGLEDVERCDTQDGAAFSIAAFLALRSSRWLLISDGQTIFVPGHLTHKVITLQQYLGLGSFHAALPSFVDSLIRWAQLPPLWVRRDKHCNVAFVTQHAIGKIRALRNAPKHECVKWGVPHLRARLRRLASNRDPILCGLIEGTPHIKAFLRAAHPLCSRQ